jgi:PKD repeat protein
MRDERLADRNRTRRVAICVVAILPLTAAAGCVDPYEVPGIAGPSTLATALQIQAVPDILTQDGASQALVSVFVHGPDGQPLRDVTLRVEISVAGQFMADFGALSARTIVTNATGRATLTYTAPAPPAESVDEGLFVAVLFTPVGVDFANAIPRTVSIRLVPPGNILPPAATPIPAFTFAPGTPREGEAVRFDASTSRPCAANDPICPPISSYQWDFGDGSTGTGEITSHAYRLEGSYTVRLTIANDRRTASTTQTLSIARTANPTAQFTISPGSVEVGQSVFVNASGSQPAPGRTLVSYTWTWGDGSTGTGRTDSHQYRREGAFTITLTVRDDLGRTGTASGQVTVGATSTPFASFVFSPTDPKANTSVFFDASASTAPTGRTISRYAWNFGDGSSGSGRTTSHTYAAAGTYTVTLVVSDSAGVQHTTSQGVTVAAGAP